MVYSVEPTDYNPHWRDPRKAVERFAWLAVNGRNYANLRDRGCWLLYDTQTLQTREPIIETSLNGLEGKGYPQMLNILFEEVDRGITCSWTWR